MKKENTHSDASPVTRTRVTRRRRLLELVMSARHETQEALQAALEAGGFRTTQSSISRDIRALGLEKRGGAYVAPRELLAGPAGLEVWQAVTTAQAAGPHLLVIHTHAAMAQAVAAAIDDADWCGVTGTVAGDDTLFVALSDAEALDGLLKRVELLADL